MCIAIYSPIGAKIPTMDVLEKCFKNNSDGCGFAYNNNGRVIIQKGYMTFDSFKKAISKADRNVNLADKGVLIHFRIETSGGVNKGCCHPFPITDETDKLKQTSVFADYAVIHNGIISLTENKANKEKISDTMVFVRDYISKIASNKHWFKNKRNMELIEILSESKIAILNANGEIASTSGFSKDEDGNYYSNDSYKQTYLRYVPYGYDYFDNCIYELMHLGENESVLYDDSFIEEYCNTVPTYIDIYGNVYASNINVKSKYINFDNLSFLGTGEVVNNSSCEPIPFRKDAYGVMYDDLGV